MKIIVIGAGPAGMMCAGIAASNGANVLLLERNKVVGRKLMITGKGRCNVTNNCSKDDFINSIPTNGRFLYSAINNFSSKDTIDFFESRNCKLKTERGNRVFPESDNAKDIVNTLFKFIKSSGVQLIEARAEEIIVKDQKVKGVKLQDGRVMTADKIVIACGGKSYPGTGSSGDGYKLAKHVGHTIIQPKPSLVPLNIEEKFCKSLQGLSLKNVALEVFDNERKKIIYNDFGEMLFTHFGVSGPIILSASAHMRNMHTGKYSLSIDLKPALSFEQLDKRVLRDFSENLHKDFSNSLGKLLPQKIIPVVIELSSINPNTKCDQITKEMRKKIVSVLKNFTLTVSSFRPINEAIVTSGGISVKEINPKTMQSKIIEGLFLAGEVIDVDAYTGGFNLQIAFSTGYTAAKSAVVSSG